MRKKPTLAGLRAGQMLFWAIPNLSIMKGHPVIGSAPCCNKGIAHVRARGSMPSPFTFYSRRQAVTAARRLMQRFAALDRDLVAEHGEGNVFAMHVPLPEWSRQVTGAAQ